MFSISPVPDDCPGDPGALLCVALNQGEGLVFVGGAQSRQEAVHIDILRSDMIPGGRLVEIHSGTAETIVRAQEPQVCPPGTVGTPPNCEPICPDGQFLVEGECQPCPNPPCGGPETGERNGGLIGRGALAVTGGGVLPFVALALILGTTGVAVLIRERARAIL